jgi:hypothetical protein
VAQSGSNVAIAYAAALAGYLTSANNLSDVASVPTSRVNLGITTYAASQFGIATGNSDTVNATAFANAVSTIATAGGGILDLPAGEFKLTNLNLTYTYGVIIRGVGSTNQGNGKGTTLRFTGTGSSALLTLGYNGSNSSVGTWLEDLTIGYDSSSFTGDLVTINNNANGILGGMRRVRFRSLGSAPTTAASWVNLTGCVDFEFDSCDFEVGSAYSIKGTTTLTGTAASNNVAFRSCHFVNYSTAAIYNSGTAWSFDGCNLEYGSSGATVVYINSARAQAVTFRGCWIGDNTPTGTVGISWQGDALLLEGNVLNILNGTFLQISNDGCNGIVLDGNLFQNQIVGVDFQNTAGHTGFAETGNCWTANLSSAPFYIAGQIPSGSIASSALPNTTIIGTHVVAPAVQNLLWGPTSNLENAPTAGDAGWQAASNGAVSLSSAKAKWGTQSLLHTTSSSGTFSLVEVVGRTLQSSNLQLVAQKLRSYTIGCWIYTATANRQGRVALDNVDATSTVQTTTYASNVPLTQNAWTWVSGTVTTSDLSGTTQSGSVSSAASPSQGNAVTYTTSSAHGLQPGQTVTVSGNAYSGFNITGVVLACPSTTTFTVNFYGIAASQSGNGGTFTTNTQFLRIRIRYSAISGNLGNNELSYYDGFAIAVGSTLPSDSSNLSAPGTWYQNSSLGTLTAFPLSGATVSAYNTASAPAFPTSGYVWMVPFQGAPVQSWQQLSYTSIDGTHLYGASGGYGYLASGCLWVTATEIGTYLSDGAITRNSGDGSVTVGPTLKTTQLIQTITTVAVSSNAGTVPVNAGIANFTNSSASAMTITLATASAIDGQQVVVRIFDYSAVAKGMTWTNTENSTVSAPTTSNGSTTSPLTVTFQYNASTGAWRCIASA